MIESIRVSCLIDRLWDSSTKQYDGTHATGTMIDVSVQSCEDDYDVFAPVGIVLMDNGTFQSVPMEFITKIV